MEQIITDLTLLETPAEPLKFMDETGTHEQEGQEIISKLKELMEHDPTILSLSAPQIGINKRIFCIRFNNEIKSFINPILKKKGEQVVSYETNVSFPNMEIAICRPKEIEVSYYSDAFKYEDNKFLGSAAKVFDQQYQLLDGIIPGSILNIFNNKEITLNDIPAIIAAEYSGGGLVIPIASEEDHLTTDDLPQVAEILGSYCDKFKAIGKSIKAGDNKELAYVYRNLKIQEQVITGKVQLIADDPKPKMNREQRRAAAKEIKKVNNKKAGK